MNRLVIVGDVEGQDFRYVIEIDKEKGKIRTGLNCEVDIVTWGKFKGILEILPELAEADFINRTIIQ